MQIIKKILQIGPKAKPPQPGDVGILVMDGDGFGDGCTFRAVVNDVEQSCNDIGTVYPGKRFHGDAFSFVVLSRNGDEPEWAILVAERPIIAVRLNA